jgi:hypothetical protein
LTHGWNDAPFVSDLLAWRLHGHQALDAVIELFDEGPEFNLILFVVDQRLPP